MPKSMLPEDDSITEEEIKLAKSKSLSLPVTTPQILFANSDHIPQDMEPVSHESDDGGFYIIEKEDYSEELPDFESYPWLDPKHALYFPTLGNDTTTTTRWDAVNKFSVENWYPYLKKHTFNSHFITLNYDDILYLMENGAPEYDCTQLENLFNEVLAEFNNKEAFMRLSTRSPKDSKYLFGEASTLMSKDRVYWNETDNKQQQLVSFVASMLKATKVKNGKKIMETIAQSPRVFGDLIALINTLAPSECKTNVILREWYDIRPDHEFRVFVSRRHRKESIVTAISQYFHFLYFDKTPQDCFNFIDESSKKVLIAQFENYILKSVDPEVAKFLNFSSEQDEDDSSDCIREYVVDLALIPASQYRGEITPENKIVIGDTIYVMMVIELNPFAPAATGCALFNWKNDLRMLWGKESCEYPVFRFRTTPREDFNHVTLLPASYETVIENALSKRMENSLSYVNSVGQKDRFFLPELKAGDQDNESELKLKSVTPM